MGFVFDDGGSGNVRPKDIFDVGYVLTPDDSSMNIGGGGAVNIPLLPSNTIAFPVINIPSIPSYTPATPTPRYVATQPPKSDDSMEIWAYVMIVVMAMIIVIVLAVVL